MSFVRCALTLIIMGQNSLPHRTTGSNRKKVYSDKGFWQVDERTQGFRDILARGRALKEARRLI